MALVASFTARHNNLNCLRLLLASLVIVSHSPELVDGDRSRELMTRLFGTLSLGQVAVDGFFLISGYLITKSFHESSSTIAFLKRRVCRIVPGFLFCFVVCVFVLAPLVGGTVFQANTITEQVRLALKLLDPRVPGVFAGLHYPILNGSMWTIPYEFRCYCLAALLGLMGVYNKPNRWTMVFIVSLCAPASQWSKLYSVNIWHQDLLGAPIFMIKFFTAFGVGALFYLFREEIFYTGRIAAALGLMLCFGLISRKTAELSLLILGGYILFWFAFNVQSAVLRTINKGPDISYGMYLYAWPIQNTVIWLERDINPWVLAALTMPLAGICGYVSYRLIEKPAMILGRSRWYGELKSARWSFNQPETAWSQKTSARSLAPSVPRDDAASHNKRSA